MNKKRLQYKIISHILNIKRRQLMQIKCEAFFIQRNGHKLTLEQKSGIFIISNY